MKPSSPSCAFMNLNSRQKNFSFLARSSTPNGGAAGGKGHFLPR